MSGEFPVLHRICAAAGFLQGWGIGFTRRDIAEFETQVFTTFLDGQGYRGQGVHGFHTFLDPSPPTPPAKMVPMYGGLRGKNLRIHWVTSLSPNR